jgi:hypothetical protein
MCYALGSETEGPESGHPANRMTCRDMFARVAAQNECWRAKLKSSRPRSGQICLMG